MLVSVVLPAYNAELYLKEAMDSILQQTFTDFELIILNDGSTDSTEDIILSYEDSRIVYVKNQENLGLIGTLNKGISLAKGKYIARMDADDIALPERLNKQISFLEANTQYGVVGAFAQIIDSKDIYKVPVTNEAIKAFLYIDSPFIHPSVVIRKDLLSSNMYDHQYHRIEDYELWVRLSAQTKFYNIPEILLKYRILEGSESSLLKSNLERKLLLTIKVLKNLFKINKIDLNSAEIENYCMLLNKKFFSNIDYSLLSQTLKKISSQNSNAVSYLSRRWVGSLLISPQLINIRFLLFYKWTYIGGRVLLKK